MGKIYLDTNLFIYFFENNPEFSTKVESILTGSFSQNQQIIVSPLIYTELLAGPIRDNNTKLIQVYTHLTQTLTNITIHDFNTVVSLKTAYLRGTYNLPIPECIHLATAIHSQCDVYYTNDKNLKQVKEIKVALL